jgi:hypothetical protein
MVLLLLLWRGPLAGQTPDASVRGSVVDTAGRPLAGAKVAAIHSEIGFTSSVKTDSHGQYHFGSLPRGLYTLKVEMPGYQGLEKQGVELAVGARDEENFNLAPVPASAREAAVAELFRIIPPSPSLPVETIASSVSVVVDQNKILQLPLVTRNIYSLFLLQPGVTSQGAIVRRGLSFSVHGQRVSGSNYLLDGMDNNDIVLTGPVARTSAEAVQEFRMINSTFSAENGRATAFVSQVVTRSGSNRLHGSLFEFLSNDKLNANTFENNSNGVTKEPLRQNQFGYSIGGPIKTNRTFFWSGLELSRLRFGTTGTFVVPSSSFISSLPKGSEAGQLLAEVPPIASAPTPTSPLCADPNIRKNQNILCTDAQFSSRIDTLLATERLDHNFSSGRDRLTVRYTLSSSTELPGFFWFSGYPSLVPTDHFSAHNSLLAWNHSFDPGHISDLRIGWSRERIHMPRPRSEIPVLQSADLVSLPGSLRGLAQRENDNVVQISETLSAQHGRSALRTGFQYRRNIENGVSLGLQSDTLGGEARFPDGFYLFPNLDSFGAGTPLIFALAVDRFSSQQLRLPDLRRNYRSNEYAAFVQDDLKLTSRFSLNLGLRYEYFGVPHDTGRSQDVNFYFGPGSTIAERLANGVLRSADQNPGDLKGLLYRRDLWNFAPSIGLAWDASGRGSSIFRAGYAVAFDRVFDTLRDLRTNSQQVAFCFAPECTSFLLPIERMLPVLGQNLGQQPPTSVIQLDENLRTPYAQNWYIGIQQTITPNFLLEMGHAGSVGRKLISRDVLNRTIVGVPPVNSNIGDDTFLSNAGTSNYIALEVGLRRRFSSGLQCQISYTYSHAVDNQSDIFEGVRTGPGENDFALASFTRELDSGADRGSANFDQRHNLVFNAIWDLPRPRLHVRWAEMLLRGWTSSAIGAYRSGFPVTVIDNSFLPDPTTGLRNNRLDFLGGPGQPFNLPDPRPVAGGVQWLDPALFRPAVGHLGDVGRGAIKGPGFWNYDFALLRQIAVTQGLRLQFRTEFYNLFNHANLSAPVTTFLSDPVAGIVNPDFGKSYYGINREFSRFGELPLENPSRRVQFGLRFEF